MTVQPTSSLPAGSGNQAALVDGVAGRGLSLDLRQASAGYGSSEVLREVSISIPSGMAIGVLGPNGAGKSTLVKVLCGSIPIRRGAIAIDGDVVERYSVRRAVRSGIAVAPEGRRVFARMTVEDNLLVGSWIRGLSRREKMAERDRMLERYPILAARRRSLAGSLSGGEAQLLAIAMAVIADPRLVILDEPSLGLAPLAYAKVKEEIIRLTDTGRSVLMVEQNIRAALQIVDYGYVLSQGVISAEGLPDELWESASLQSLCM